MKLSFLLIILLALLLDCQNSNKKGTDTTLLGALLLASRPPSPTTPPPGGGTTTQTLTVSSVTRSSSTPIISGDSVDFTINISPYTDPRNSDPRNYILKLYFSTDSNVDTSDTLMGTIIVNESMSNIQTLTVTIPSTLVPETEGLPKYFYYKLLGENATTPSVAKLTVFPHKSQVAIPPPYLIGETTVTTRTFDTNTEQFFIKDFTFTTENQWTFSAFDVAATLDVDIALVQETSDFSIVSNLVKNDNGSGRAERAAYTGTGVNSDIYLRVRKVSGTGTFKAAGMSNQFVPAHSRPSCNGGTGVFANRCVDYLDIEPGNSSVCAAIQGTGSTYSNFPCSSTNRIALCFANPLVSDSRAVISFYTPADTTSSAATACGSDILKTP